MGDVLSIEPYLMPHCSYFFCLTLVVSVILDPIQASGTQLLEEHISDAATTMYIIANCQLCDDKESLLKKDPT